jgi:cytochrome c-type biogenesis protein CcmI
MTLFYLCLLLFTLAGILVVCLPWLKKHQSLSANTLSNTGLIKQRLVELHIEQQQGLLSEVDRLQSENELKLALLDEVQDTSRTTSSSKWVLISGGLSSLGGGAGVYWQANQIKQVSQWQVAKAQTSKLGERILKGDENIGLNDLQAFALGLRSRLAAKPEDAIGWMLLGRVSGALNRIDSSIAAFEKSLQYDPTNTGTLTSYAQALLMTGQEEATTQAKGVLLRILQLEPDNTTAMGVLAVVASQLGDKALALVNWQKLQRFVPQNDPNYASISQRIVELTAQMTPRDLLVPESTSVLSAQPSGKSVLVTVNLSPALVDKLPATGFLFVFAQQSSGEVRMPAAVQKMPLSAFPLQVILSDANAMLANYTLSQLEQIKLVARVSMDENVAQAPGELQGQIVLNLQPEGESLGTVTIDKEL